MDALFRRFGDEGTMRTRRGVASVAPAERDGWIDDGVPGSLGVGGGVEKEGNDAPVRRSTPRKVVMQP